MNATAPPAPIDPAMKEAAQAIDTLVKDLSRRDAKIARGKRASQRFDLNAALKLGTRMGATPIKPLCDAWGLDLSINGVGMLTQQEFLPGRDVFLHLQSITGCPGWVKLRVIYCQKLVGTMYRSGAVFELGQKVT